MNTEITYVPDEPDIEAPMSTSADKPTDVTTDEVIEMLGEEDIEIFGRMPVGSELDVSDFDELPRNEVELNEDTAAEFDIQLAGAEPAEEFESPPPDQLPILRSAMRHFQDSESPDRTVRIDTDETYGDFVCKAAVREIERRLNELREAVEEHAADHHGGEMKPMRQWDEILGAAQTIADLRSAASPGDAVNAMPEVPLDLPDFAQGKVRAWRDGPCVVVSLRFCAADGTPRIATGATRPTADAEDVAGCAIQQGVDPVTVLGALHHLSGVAAGKRLVRDIAGCALKVHRRADVLGMREPVLLIGGATGGNPPLAAIMYLQQLCNSGDKQACKEMRILEAVAQTPSGQQVAAPLLQEAKRRLDVAHSTVLGGRRLPQLGLMSYYSRWL